MTCVKGSLFVPPELFLSEWLTPLPPKLVFSEWITLLPPELLLSEWITPFELLTSTHPPEGL